MLLEIMIIRAVSTDVIVYATTGCRQAGPCHARYVLSELNKLEIVPFYLLTSSSLFFSAVTGATNPLASAPGTIRGKHFCL
jgi:hypothetical protein